MTRRSEHMLLNGTTVLIRVLTILLLLGGIATAVAAPLIWWFQPDVAAAFVRKQPALDPGDVLPALTVLLILAAVSCVLGVLFLRKLAAIVGTVASGDPFVADNADRLTTMGWLGLALLAVRTALGFAVLPLETALDERGAVSFDAGGALLVLVLFVLASVFRTGAAMRRELEETV